MPTLSPEQKQAVVLAGDTPIPITDPDSDASYVLIRAEVFERILAAAEGDLDPREYYPVIDLIMAKDDANDPYLSTYQRFVGSAIADLPLRAAPVDGPQ
jgi:hypothetical protein